MKDYLILATKQGVAVVQRQGDDWQEIRRNLTTHESTSLSVHGGMVLAGTTEGVFRSEDSAESWQVASVGLTDPHVRWISHHPEASGVVLAGTEPAAIYISENGGKDWNECPQVSELRDQNDWYLPYSSRAGCVRGFAFHGQRVYAAVEQGWLAALGRWRAQLDAGAG